MGKERESVKERKKVWERVFTFSQLLSLLTQANLSSTHEVWLVNMNCNSLVDSTLSAEVKSMARLPHSGGCVNYNTRHAWKKKLGIIILKILISTDLLMCVFFLWQFMHPTQSRNTSKSAVLQAVNVISPTDVSLIASPNTE